jgi:hypothetical protein
VIRSGESFGVGEGEPLSEKPQAARVGEEGVGTLPYGREMSLEAVQELSQEHLGIHVTPLW